LVESNIAGRMRSVVQRVLSASVTIEGTRVSEIGPGLLVLLGVGKGDSEEDAEWMARKISQLRIFQDDAGKMNRNLLEGTRQLLAVSQFTLYGDARKGNRPSFIEACPPEEAKRLFALFCEGLRELGIAVGEGVFAAHMQVALVNDGPVTILLDSRG
jgi:D-tyrosyl-tRNA(Tyr) deacylase